MGGIPGSAEGANACPTTRADVSQAVGYTLGHICELPPGVAATTLGILRAVSRDLPATDTEAPTPDYSAIVRGNDTGSLTPAERAIIARQTEAARARKPQPFAAEDVARDSRRYLREQFLQTTPGSQEYDLTLAALKSFVEYNKRLLK